MKFSVSDSLIKGSLLLIALIVVGCSDSKEENDLYLGDKAIREFDYKKAYKHFRRSLAHLEESSPKWRQATYGKMIAAWHSTPTNPKLIAEAESLAEELIKDKRTPSDLLNRTQIDLARIYETEDFRGDRVRTEEARLIYDDVMLNAGEIEMRYEAMLRLANSYRKDLTESSFLKAEEIIENFLSENPAIDYWTTISWQTLADLRGIFIQNPETAYDAYTEAFKLGFIDPNNLDMTYWRMAVWAEEIGKLPEAKGLYQKIIDDLPRSTYTEVAAKEVARLDDLISNN